MRSERSFDELMGALDASRQQMIERLRVKSTSEDVAVKEEIEWAIGCLRLCRRLDISPSDKAYEIVSPVRTPSAEVRLVSDNESDRPELWTELKIEGQKVRLSDGDVVVVKGHR